MATSFKYVLALDVGERRIGVASARTDVAIANPLTTLERSAASVAAIKKLVADHQASVLVVGLPRGLEGQETAQTKAARAFAAGLKAGLNVPIILQDEALTSRKAESELAARGKPYVKADIDALAATYILEDYLAEHQPHPAPEDAGHRSTYV